METTKSHGNNEITKSSRDINIIRLSEGLRFPRLASFIAKALNYFNFGRDIKRWVSTFYSTIESTVVNNGYTTNWFKPRCTSGLSPLPLPVNSFD